MVIYIIHIFQILLFIVDGQFLQITKQQLSAFQYQLNHWIMSLEHLDYLLMIGQPLNTIFSTQNSLEDGLTRILLYKDVKVG
jgi:hypothetical protein